MSGPLYLAQPRYRPSNEQAIAHAERMDPMPLTYRMGTLADAEALHALGLRSYGQYRSALTPANWEKFHAFMAAPDTYTQLIRTSTCFVCERDTEIVGMAFLVPNGRPTDLFDAAWSYIRMVGVDPDFTGNGIAKRLTTMCIDHAHRTGERYIALHTSEFMDAARHIYEGFGFKVVRSLTRYDKQYWIYLLDLNTDRNDRISH